MKRIASIIVLAVVSGQASLHAQDPASLLPPAVDPGSLLPPAPVPEPAPVPAPAPVTTPEPEPVSSVECFAKKHPRLGQRIHALVDKNKDGKLSAAERRQAVRVQIELHKRFLSERQEQVREAVRERLSKAKARHKAKVKHHKRRGR